MVGRWGGGEGWQGGPELEAGSEPQLREEPYPAPWLGMFNEIIPLYCSRIFSSVLSVLQPGLSGAVGRGVFHWQGGVEHRERTGWRAEEKDKGHLFQDILRAACWGIIGITRVPTAGLNLGCG